MPEFFLITLVSNETTRQYQQGEATADFSINLFQFADVCSLRVSIIAGNSVGMSTPSEAVEVGKSQFMLIQNKLPGESNCFVTI